MGIGILMACGAAAWLAQDGGPPPPPPGEAMEADASAPPVGSSFAWEPAPDQGDPGVRSPATTEDAPMHLVVGVVRDELGEVVSKYRAGVVSASPADARVVPALSSFASSNGRFELQTHLDPPWLLFVQAPGFVAGPPIRLQDTSPNEVRVTHKALIHGRCLDPMGAPVPGVELECRSAADGEAVLARTCSANDGNFRLVPPGPGHYQVRAHGESHHDEVVCTTGTPAHLDVTMTTTVTVTFVVTSGARPVAAARLQRQHQAGVQDATTDADGIATWPCLPRGRHQITATAAGLAARELAIDTREPNQSQFRLAIDLQPLAR